MKVAQGCQPKKKKKTKGSDPARSNSKRNAMATTIYTNEHFNLRNITVHFSQE